MGVLVSGRGSNLQALLDRQAAPGSAFNVVLVISNHADAYALARADQRSVPAAVVRRRDYASRRDQQLAMAELLRRAEVDLVVLAGFDRVIESSFIAAYPDHIINVHPSLLPSFAGGLHAQAEAWQWGVKVSGCTVHFVTEAVDGGPIILQAAVPVLEEDTPEILADRILAEEHKCLPRAVELIARGRVTIEGRRVRIAPAPENER
ncbi:MAG: phosphoribosylglycinamide formyltransferase [Chloroflexota bacterium]